MIDPDRIFDLATDIKNAVVNFYASDITAVALPARVCVVDSPFAVVNRCEQFTVACERTIGWDVNPAIQSFDPKRGTAQHVMRSAVFALAMCRCNAPVPERGGSTVADEEESARTVYGDAGRMLNALVTAEKAGDLPGCTSVVFLDWSAPQPEGGLATGTLRVQIGLTRA